MPLRKTTQGGFQSLGARLDGTNKRLDQTIDRLDRLDRRTTTGFIAINTKIADLARAVTDLTRVVQRNEQRFDHTLRFGLGAEVRSLHRRMVQIESRFLGRRALRPRKRRRR